MQDMADWIAGALDAMSWSGGCCRGRRGRGVKQAHLPALCLMKAEESEANIKGALMALPGLHIDPLRSGRGHYRRWDGA